MAKEPEETLKKVAAIGYKEVEPFGYSDGKFFGKTPKEYACSVKRIRYDGSQWSLYDG